VIYDNKFKTIQTILYLYFIFLQNYHKWKWKWSMLKLLSGRSKNNFVGSAKELYKKLKHDEQCYKKF